MNDPLNAELVNLRNNVPRVYFALYQGMLDVGFDQGQAFTLLQTYILSMGAGGCRPNGGRTSF